MEDSGHTESGEFCVKSIAITKIIANTTHVKEIDADRRSVLSGGALALLGNHPD